MIKLQSAALAIAFTCMTLAGCGGDDGGFGPPVVYTTQIQSDPAFDGDIAQTSPTTFTVTQGMSTAVQSVFAGIDFDSGAEYRTFLDFPLTGSAAFPATPSSIRRFWISMSTASSRTAARCPF